MIRLTALYYRVFGRAFSSLVQDIYFVWNRSWFPERTLPRKKLARARQYALHARWHKALPLYREVLASAAGPAREDALFFSGMALLEAERPRPALKALNTLAGEFPGGGGAGRESFTSTAERPSGRWAFSEKPRRLTAWRPGIF